MARVTGWIGSRPRNLRLAAGRFRRTGSDTVRAGILAPLLAATVLLGAPGGPRAAPGSAPTVRLAVLPCSNIETTFKKFYPLLAYLRSETGLRVSVMVPADLDEFESLTKNGQIEAALQDPHTFMRFARFFDPSMLLQTLGPDGTSSQSGVVVVRRDSGVSDLAQLRGRTVMFGPRASTPKWVAARLLFESSGIVVDRDLKALNGGCCEDIAFAVSVRSVDAGVICDHFLGQHEARQKDLGVDRASLKVIARTPPFPTRIFAARNGVSPDVTGAIARALLRLDPAVPEHARILSSAEIGGVQRTTQEDYVAAVARSVPRGRL
jgi:phosphonate transport system substrate-binding protein